MWNMFQMCMWKVHENCRREFYCKKCTLYHLELLCCQLRWKMIVHIKLESDMERTGLYRCGRKTWRFLSPVILATGWGGVMQPRSMVSWFHAISLAMEQWTAQHHAFIVEAYFKNSDLAVKTQWLFREHFDIPHYGCVPCRNTIK